MQRELSKIIDPLQPNLLLKIKQFIYKLFGLNISNLRDELFASDAENVNHENTESENDYSENILRTFYPEGKIWKEVKIVNNEKVYTKTFFPFDGLVQSEETEFHVSKYNVTGILIEEWDRNQFGKNGYFRTYYENGRIKEEFIYQNGIRTEEYKLYNEDGTLKYENKIAV